MKFKICASVAAQTMNELVKRIQEAERKEADLVEVRLDYLNETPDIRRIREATSLPLIATNRMPNEGGLFNGVEERRVSYLCSAALAGFEYVDLELSMPRVKDFTERLKKEAGVVVIISHHNFKSTPGPGWLKRVLEEEIVVGADVCKIVTMAKRAEDNLTCLNFTCEVSKTEDIICFCMGGMGIPSRLLSPLLGGYMTYASVERGMEAASGQLTIEETRWFYELLKP